MNGWIRVGIQESSFSTPYGRVRAGLQQTDIEAPAWEYPLFFLYAFSIDAE